MKKAIGYVRVSTDCQYGDDKFGATAQYEAINRYASDNGYEIVRFYEEIGSGAKARPIIEEIVYAQGELDYEAVIVFKNDRVARDTKLYFYYLYTLEKKGISLISTQEEFDEGNDFANLYRALLQFVAEQERKNITARTVAGRRVKALRGGFCGGTVPFGYRNENSHLVIDEYEAKVVSEIFSLRKKGYGYGSITSTLNSEGLVNRKGNKFSRDSIRTILDNEKLYKGYYKWSTDWVKGEHEAII